jgi:hypothetical protein
LTAAAALAVAVSVAEIVHVVGRDDVVPALRGFLVLVVGSQLGLAWGVLRRSSGAVLALFVCELTAVVASLAGGLAEGQPRLLLAAAAAGVVVLLTLSMRAFPSPQLPPITPRRFE